MPIIMSMVMYEKEYRLREIMKMMGLRMSVYWTVTCVRLLCFFCCLLLLCTGPLSHFLTCSILFFFFFSSFFLPLSPSPFSWSLRYLLFLAEYTLLVVVFWIFGAAAKINFFTLHSPIILFLYLMIWGNCLIAFSMLLTIFFEKTRTAVAVGFILIFAFVFGGYMIFETLSSDPNTPDSAYYAYQWLPPMAFMRATVFIVNRWDDVWHFSHWHFSHISLTFLSHFSHISHLFFFLFCCSHHPTARPEFMALPWTTGISRHCLASFVGWFWSGLHVSSSCITWRKCWLLDMVWDHILAFVFRVDV